MMAEAAIDYELIVTGQFDNQETLESFLGNKSRAPCFCLNYKAQTRFIPL